MKNYELVYSIKPVEINLYKSKCAGFVVRTVETINNTGYVTQISKLYTKLKKMEYENLTNIEKCNYEIDKIEMRQILTNIPERISIDHVLAIETYAANNRYNNNLSHFTKRTGVLENEAIYTIAAYDSSNIDYINRVANNLTDIRSKNIYIILGSHHEQNIQNQ